MHILVTGATGNLGKSLIQSALADGYVVTGLDREGFRFEDLGYGSGGEQSYNLKPDTFNLLEVDLQDESATHAAVAKAIQVAPIDVAVLTAGGFAMGSIPETSSSKITDMYRLNFLTAYHVAKPVYEHMMEQGRGRIFLVGARPGLDASAGKTMAGYALSKSLVFRLAELLNAGAGKKDVVTSVVVPSIIDTPSNREAMPGADFSQWVSPQEIARIILWHAGPEAAALREPVIKVYGKS